MSEAFDRLCDVIESATELDRLAARGTVRIALKRAGLEPRSVTSSQLVVVAEKILGEELAARGVDWSEALLEKVRASQQGIDDAGADTPDAVFQRLGSAAG